MKKVLIGLIVSLLAISAGIVYLNKKIKEFTNEKCCEKCKEKELKYYHAENDLCGELCSTTEGLQMRLKFQPNLKEGNCKDQGYKTYFNTTVFKSGEATIELDFYKK